MSERIRAAAAEREQLLRTIAATQHAKAALKQVGSQITDLTNKEWDAGKIWGQLLAGERKNEAAVKALRDHSHLRKLFHASKVASEAEQAEALFRESIVWTDKAKVKRELITTELAALKEQRDALRAVQAQHTDAVDRLDALYASVFDGPTPDLPDEDALEAAVAAAQERFDEVQAVLSHAMAVANNLHRAHGCAVQAVESIRTALAASGADVLASTTSIVTNARRDYDDIERYNLKLVNKRLAEAEYYMAVARQMDPEHVSPQLFTRPTVDDGMHSKLGMLDDVLSNPVTDLLFQFRIEDSVDGVRQVEAIVRDEVARADARGAALVEAKKPLEAALDAARKQLTDLRVELFDKTLRGRDEKEAPPPAYEGVPAAKGVEK